MKPTGIPTALRTGAYLLGITLARLLAGMVRVNDQTVNDLPQCPLGGPGSVRQGMAFWQPNSRDEFTEWPWLTVGVIGRALSDVIIPNQNSQRVQPRRNLKSKRTALPQINPAPRSKKPQTLPKWHHRGNHLMSRFWTYENKLVILFSLGGGIAALDAQALFYLTPFVADDLKLNNAQAGLLASLVLITWSISGFLVGNFADKSGKRKTCLVTAFILFGLWLFLTGLAASFTMLLAVRALIGLAEGPVIPVAQSIMAEESSPHRRGLNMGLVQNFGSQLVGSFISPLLLIAVATAYSWQAAFYFAGVPALLIALLTALVLRPAPRRSPASQSASANAPSTVRPDP